MDVGCGLVAVALFFCGRGACRGVSGVLVGVLGGFWGLFIGF